MKPIEITKKQAKIIGISFAVFLGVLIIAIIGTFIYRSNKKESNNIKLEGYIMLPDLTGMQEEEGIMELQEEGFENISVKYIYDQFTSDGRIIKTNYHIRSILSPEDEIIVYVCDESIIKKDTKNNGEIKTEIPYDSLNQVEVIDLKIKDGKIYAVIRNNNKDAIKNVTYKISYFNNKGEQIGGNTYIIDSGVILPGEKIMFEEELEKNGIYSIAFHSFNYQTIEVPDKQR